jgi:NhaA family Na+:H+ antiporter
MPLTRRSAADRRGASPRTIAPLRDFLHTEAAGGALLIAGAVVALIWANWPGSSSYAELWNTVASIRIGQHGITLTLRQWVNEGLITVFFFVVGLEIKRELVRGDLADRRAAMLPAVAALGGMAAPALIYLSIAGGSAPRGWAIVVATDIPLALGVLAIAGSRVPSPMRVFLLALAIVDDIASLIIIAAVYSSGIRWGWVGAAVVSVAAAAMFRRIRLQTTWIFVACGVVMWLCLYEAGVNPTLTGVAMGLLAPTSPRLTPELVDVEELADVSTVEAARTTTKIAKGSVSVVEWLEHILHPWASYVIVPLFAVANTGISFTTDRLTAALRSPVTWAIVVARVVGKPVGIVVVRRLVSGRARASAEDWTPRVTVGVAASAGMGFTVALFIAELALRDEAQRWNATFAIVLSAVLAGATSLAILSPSPRRPPA